MTRLEAAINPSTQLRASKLEVAIDKVLRKWLGVKGAPRDEFKNEVKEIAKLLFKFRLEELNIPRGKMAKEHWRMECELRRVATSLNTRYDSTDRRRIGQMVGRYIKSVKAGAL